MAAAKYRLLSTIPLPQLTYIVDLTHDGNNQVYISVRSTAVPVDEVSYLDQYYIEEIDLRINIRVLAYDGDYIDAYKDYVVYGTRTSVYEKKVNFGRHPRRNRIKKTIIIFRREWLQPNRKRS